jgi:hypothetical protein
VQVIAAVLLVLAAAPDAGTLCGTARCESFKTAKAAFERVLERAPVVLAVGEYHEIEGGPKVKSAIGRFTVELLPSLKGKATSLVLETWMTNGNCGEVEKTAVAEVKKVTQRPDETEDELTTLLNKSYAQGIANHILRLDCDEYRSMLDEKGKLDAAKSLLLVRRKIEEKALEVREKKEGGLPGKVLVLYGGAIHNDLKPLEDWAEYSFGPSLSKAIGGGYVELDLLVPEFASTDEDLQKENWFAPALKLAGTSLTVLVTPHPDVYMMVFPRKKTSKGK